MATETVRFSQVVEQAGQPESYTLWAKPDQDKAFAALLRQNRVMTVHQETVGAKADYGTVGYTEDRHRSLLVFPKSLKRFEGKRIIGIKYEELKGVEPRAKSANEKAPPPKKHPVKRKPKEKAAPTPLNQIPFPKQEVTTQQKPAKPDEPTDLAEDIAEDLAEEVASLKKALRKALEALSKDKPVTAFNLLKSALQSD